MTQSAVWRDLAAEARAVAATLHNPDLRRQMLVIARRYEAFAKRDDMLDRAKAANPDKQDTTPGA